jgi:hypothetical protein
MNGLFETKSGAPIGDAIVQAILKFSTKAGISPADAGRKDAREAFSSAKEILISAASANSKKAKRA